MPPANCQSPTCRNGGAGGFENRGFRPGNRRGFTLIEIMVVVAIMGLILAASFPSLYSLIRKEGFRKTVDGVVDACSATRAQAILHNETATLVFHPLDGTFDGGGRSGRIENASIEMLDVNLGEFKNADEARVRFFPDGRCDEMTLVLRSDKNQWQTISLEITTGIVTVSNKLP